MEKFGNEGNEPVPVETEKTTTFEKNGLLEKFKGRIRSTALAALVGASSLVAVGCSEEESSAEKVPAQTTSQTAPEKGSVRSTIGDAKREQRREQWRAEQEELNMENQKAIQKIKTVAIQKGIVSQEEFDSMTRESIAYTTTGHIVIEATINGESVPFSASDYTTQELQTLRKMATFGSNASNTRLQETLRKIGVFDAVPSVHSTEPSTRGAGGQQGNTYPNDW